MAPGKSDSAVSGDSLLKYTTSDLSRRLNSQRWVGSYVDQSTWNISSKDGIDHVPVKSQRATEISIAFNHHLPHSLCYLVNSEGGLKTSELHILHFDELTLPGDEM